MKSKGWELASLELEYSILSSSNDAPINKDRLDINKLINHIIHIYDSDLVWRMQLIIEVKKF